MTTLNNNGEHLAVLSREGAHRAGHGGSTGPTRLLQQSRRQVHRRAARTLRGAQRPVRETAHTNEPLPGGQDEQVRLQAHLGGDANICLFTGS